MEYYDHLDISDICDSGALGAYDVDNDVDGNGDGDPGSPDGYDDE